MEKTPIGLQIKKTSHCIRRYVDDFVEKNMKWDVTGVEGMALGRILAFYKHNPEKKLTATDVMKFMNINKSATSKLISNLEAKGYIETLKSQEDGRSKAIGLTSKSVMLKDDFENCFKMMNEGLESALTKEEIEQLSGLLLKIQNKLDEMGGK